MHLRGFIAAVHEYYNKLTANRKSFERQWRIKGKIKLPLNESSKTYMFTVYNAAMKEYNMGCVGAFAMPPFLYIFLLRPLMEGIALSGMKG